MSVTHVLVCGAVLAVTVAAGGAAGLAATRATGTSSSAAPAATVSPLCTDALARRQAADAALYNFKPSGDRVDLVIYEQLKADSAARSAAAQNDVRRYCP